MTRKQHLKTLLEKAFEPIDAKRSQTAEQLIDDVGRPVTGHAAIDNIDVVGALVFAFWNPDRGVRMKNEYEENPDGTLRQTGRPRNGRGLEHLSRLPEHDDGRARARGLSLFTTFFTLVEPEVKELLHVPPRMFLESASSSATAPRQLGKPPHPQAAAEVVHLNDWEGAVRT